MKIPVFVLTIVFSSLNTFVMASSSYAAADPTDPQVVRQACIDSGMLPNKDALKYCVDGGNADTVKACADLAKMPIHGNPFAELLNVDLRPSVFFECAITKSNLHPTAENVRACMSVGIRYGDQIARDCVGFNIEVVKACLKVSPVSNDLNNDNNDPYSRCLYSGATIDRINACSNIGSTDSSDMVDCLYQRKTTIDQIKACTNTAKQNYQAGSYEEVEMVSKCIGI